MFEGQRVCATRLLNRVLFLCKLNSIFENFVKCRLTVPPATILLQRRSNRGALHVLSIPLLSLETISPVQTAELRHICSEWSRPQNVEQRRLCPSTRPSNERPRIFFNQCALASGPCGAHLVCTHSRCTRCDS